MWWKVGKVLYVGLLFGIGVLIGLEWGSDE